MRPPEVFVRELSPEEGGRLKVGFQAREVSVQASAGDDLASVLDRDAGAADRGGGALGRVACA